MISYRKIVETKKLNSRFLRDLRDQSKRDLVKLRDFMRLLSRFYEKGETGREYLLLREFARENETLQDFRE